MGIAPTSIDRVLVSGGTARIPLVQQAVATLFQQDVVPVADPELSVCLGTGIRAAALTEHAVVEAAHRR